MTVEVTDNNTIIIDFDSLPQPTVIEEPNYDTILAEMREQFHTLAPEYAELTEADPINKVLETYAYRELYLRQRVNSAVQANMLPFASGADLDMLGAFYNVQRNVVQEENLDAYPPIPEILETDESFRTRIRDRIQGWSTAGGEYHYRFWAREGIGDVADVKVFSPEGGKVNIAVLSVSGDGVPTDELIAEVNAQVSRSDVRMLTDTVEVLKAEKVEVDVDATVTLRTDTPQRVYDELVANFETSFKTLRKLGRDVTRSWLLSQLFVDGVYSVTLADPVEDLILGNTEFPALRNVNIRFGGRKE
tara:strand:- start:167 stop:1078 length:912 start_codon:yes stop_codon:yes gene_type:complete